MITDQSLLIQQRLHTGLFMLHKTKRNIAPTVEEELKQQRYSLEQFSVGFLNRETQSHHKKQEPRQLGKDNQARWETCLRQRGPQKKRPRGMKQHGAQREPKKDGEHERKKSCVLRLGWIMFLPNSRPSPSSFTNSQCVPLYACLSNISSLLIAFLLSHPFPSFSGLIVLARINQI